MKKLSDLYPVLKRFNKKANKYRDIRVGVSVVTPRGLGIVTWRNKNTVIVVVKISDVKMLGCWRYVFDIDEIKLTSTPVSRNSDLYKCAWYWIINQAVVENQQYELLKHRAIFKEWESKIPGKRVDRKIPLQYGGSKTYRRYSGVNSKGQPFDFEINIDDVFIPAGDRILYALGFNNGYITDINGNGWIYRRPITDNDVNYGLAKNAFGNGKRE